MCAKGSDRLVELLRFERLAREEGWHSVAGVDEVGRGPLAGPVVAAAVLLPLTRFSLPVDDSKQLTEASREAFASQLDADPEVHIGLGIVSPADIDRLNILRATHRAMREALEALPVAPDFALVDGLRVEGLPVPARFLVKGDSRSASIAAASIVAKVYRDRLMTSYDAEYPGYGFARNKGYGTREHLEALSQLGATPIHRRSFAPVARAVGAMMTQLEFPLDDCAP